MKLASVYAVYTKSHPTPFHPEPKSTLYTPRTYTQLCTAPRKYTFFMLLCCLGLEVKVKLDEQQHTKKKLWTEKSEQEEEEKITTRRSLCLLCHFLFMLLRIFFSLCCCYCYCCCFPTPHMHVFFSFACLGALPLLCLFFSCVVEKHKTTSILNIFFALLLCYFIFTFICFGVVRRVIIGAHGGKSGRSFLELSWIRIVSCGFTVQDAFCDIFGEGEILVEKNVLRKILAAEKGDCGNLSIEKIIYGRIWWK